MIRRLPITCWLGALLILACEALLFIDVHHRGGIVIPPLPGVSLPDPSTDLQYAARWVAVNMTVLCWIGYLLVFDGLLVGLSRHRNSPGAGAGLAIASIRERPSRFLVAWLTSVPVWCLFDWINFYFMDAWRYHGLPPYFSQRVVGYFIAFAAISPGMFLAAQLYQHLGLRRVATTHLSDKCNTRAAWTVMLSVLGILFTVIVLVILSIPSDIEHADHRRFLLVSTLVMIVPGSFMLIWTRCLFSTAFAFGLGFTSWAIFVRDPIGNLALWVGLIFLLDPLNHRFLASPSLLADWRAGRWGRTLALFAGGATCGLCWEFWNYWALTKWTYNLPFLGPAAQWRYFEMPLLGFLGFLPFAGECWVMLNTIIGSLQRLGLRLAEPLPDEDAVM